MLVLLLWARAWLSLALLLSASPNHPRPRHLTPRRVGMPFRPLRPSLGQRCQSSQRSSSGSRAGRAGAGTPYGRAKGPFVSRSSWMVAGGHRTLARTLASDILTSLWVPVARRASPRHPTRSPPHSWSAPSLTAQHHPPLPARPLSIHPAPVDGPKSPRAALLYS